MSLTRLAATLEDADLDFRLAVLIGGEDALELRGHDHVLIDQHREQVAGAGDAERQRGDVLQVHAPRALVLGRRLDVLQDLVGGALRADQRLGQALLRDLDQLRGLALAHVEGELLDQLRGLVVELQELVLQALHRGGQILFVLGAARRLALQRDRAALRLRGRLGRGFGLGRGHLRGGLGRRLRRRVRVVEEARRVVFLRLADAERDRAERAGVGVLVELGRNRAVGLGRLQQRLQARGETLVVERPRAQLLDLFHDLARDLGLAQRDFEGVFRGLVRFLLQRVRRQRVRVESGADRDHLVGIDVAARLLGEEVLHRVAHCEHAALTADQQHFADLAARDARGRETALAQLERALDQRLAQRHHLLARQRAREVELRALRALGEERQVDARDLGVGQLDLGLLGRFLQTQARAGNRGEIRAVLLLERLLEPLGDRVVEILAAEIRIAVGGDDFEGVAARAHDGDVEGAAAQVVHGEREVLVLLVAVGERGCGRLVDQPQHFEAGVLRGELGRLALHVVEVRRHGDHRLLHLLAERLLRHLAHALQDLGRDLDRRELRTAHFEHHAAERAGRERVRQARGGRAHLGRIEGVADQALDRDHRTLGRRDRVALGGGSDQLAPLVDRDAGGGRGASLVRKNDRLAVLYDGNAAIQRPEIDADYRPRHASLSAGVRRC